MLINTGNISRKVLSKVLRSFVKNFERLHQPRIYEVPVGAGVIWNVFEIRNGEIIDINELTE